MQGKYIFDRLLLEMNSRKFEETRNFYLTKTFISFRMQYWHDCTLMECTAGRRGELCTEISFDQNSSNDDLLIVHEEKSSDRTNLSLDRYRCLIFTSFSLMAK